MNTNNDLMAAWISVGIGTLGLLWGVYVAVRQWVTRVRVYFGEPITDSQRFVGIHLVVENKSAHPVRVIGVGFRDQDWAATPVGVATGPHTPFVADLLGELSARTGSTDTFLQAHDLGTLNLDPRKPLIAFVTLENGKPVFSKPVTCAP
jgi:hypothetical protein